MTIRSVCVFCGAASPGDPVYLESAKAVGALLARENIELVFGAGRVGLMGAVADAALEAGGRALGIIPEHIKDLEVAHTGVQETIVTETMMERKRLMIERSDAFLVLGGGFGTLDELFEVLTFKQLRLHNKAVVLLNVGSYWTPLVSTLQHMIDVGFVRESDKTLFSVVDSIDEVMPALRAVQGTVPDPRTKIDPNFKG